MPLHPLSILLVLLQFNDSSPIEKNIEAALHISFAVREQWVNKWGNATKPQEFPDPLPTSASEVTPPKVNTNSQIWATIWDQSLQLSYGGWLTYIWTHKSNTSILFDNMYFRWSFQLKYNLFITMTRGDWN